MTTDPRQEALAVLTELAQLAPEIRLGQLMAHLGLLSEDEINRSIWDVEDAELLTVLHRHRRELAARQQQEPNQALKRTLAQVCRVDNLSVAGFGCQWPGRFSVRRAPAAEPDAA